LFTSSGKPGRELADGFPLAALEHPALQVSMLDHVTADRLDIGRPPTLVGDGPVIPSTTAR